MGIKRLFLLFVLLSLAIVGMAAAGATTAMAMTTEQTLGKKIYFDRNLSNPAGQACASCHLPKSGFADPDSFLPVSEGVIPGRFGTRNAPSSAYAAFSPVFNFNRTTQAYEGGQFWDGRAADLQQQAKGPFLNPVEMNNTKEGVVQAVRNSGYASLFRITYGFNSLDDVDTAYNYVAKAIASFEGTKAVNKFSSKYDEYLKGEAALTSLKGEATLTHMKGETALTPQERNGLALFNDPAKGNCAACHPSTSTEGMTPPLFTDYTYDNLGIPKNSEIESLIGAPVPVDLGLGGFLATTGAPDASLQNGKFKVPTLRNIAKTGPYGHNGYFKSLEEIVHFYNTRDVLPSCSTNDPGEKITCWPSPEMTENVNRNELGNLGLSSQEEDDIVAFLRTLSDGYDD